MMMKLRKSNKEEKQKLVDYLWAEEHLEEVQGWDDEAIRDLKTWVNKARIMLLDRVSGKGEIEKIFIVLLGDEYVDKKYRAYRGITEVFIQKGGQIKRHGVNPFFPEDYLPYERK